MRRRTGVALLAAFALGGVLLASTPAQAVQPYNLSVVTNPDPVNFTPNVLDGDVRAIAEIGDITLVGGTFTQVQDALGGPILARTNLFAYRSATGEIISTFNPSVASTVYAIEPAGDGTTAYVGGQFDNINSARRTKRLARINVMTGITDPAFVSPGFDGQVKNLKVRGGLLYAGGNFLVAGTTSRPLLATMNPATGALSDKISGLTFGGPRNGGALQVIAFDITPDGSELYAIGNFTILNGVTRYQIAKLDLTTTPASVSSWDTTRYTTACSASFDTYMRDIDISTDGSYFIIGTTGAYSGGVNAGTLCDGIARWETGRSGSNQQPSWVDYTGGDTVWSVSAGGEAVYVGGHFRWLNNPYASDKAGQGAVAREAIAAVDPRNGLPLTWNPGRERGVGAFELTQTARGMYMGSDTDRTGNNEYHAKLALFPAAGGAALPDDFTGRLPGTVYSLGVNSGDTVTGRAFDGNAVTGTTAVSNGGNAFSASRGAFMVDGKLYTGLLSGAIFTQTGSLQVRSFDGTTFGAPATVNLNGLTDFANDLKTITGMFYDPATGRLYYTMSGQTSLFYRYFQTESQTVGAVRFTAQASITGLNWSQVSSMFQVGTSLYVASSSDGNLHRYTWNAAAGTANADGVVVGAGQNWRARGAFVYAPANGSNAAPSAAFTQSCAGLQCSVTSTSTDSDGTIASVAWNFGDGGTASTTTANHLYAAGGTYTITLTVTDDDGATNATSQQVTVTAPASPVAFRAGVGADASSTQVSAVIPASVQAGDTLLMFATVNSSTVTVGTPTANTGWTQVQALPGSSIQSVLWSKTAVAGDAGATVRVPLSATAKVGLQVLAYSGSTAGTPVSASAGSLETAAVAAHTTPVVTVGTTGSYLVSYWADKSTSTAWTLPTGLTGRATSLGTGTAHITSASADAGTGAVAGSAGGLTATADTANSKAVMWSVVIAP